MGSGGVIAKELAKNLPQYTEKIRLVSRNPKQINPTDETLLANLTNRKQVFKAVRDSEVIYVTIGLPYKLSIWEKFWPLIMKNVIDACKEYHTKLVFFDNVYLYGKVEGWMTENTPVNPCSKKGEIRAKIAQQLMDEINKGNLKALIVRSADFYGPVATNTFILPMVFDNLKKGKSAKWIVNDKVKHSFTFTPDAGKATALLGNKDSAYNQVWHLPTDKNVLSGRQFIEEVAKVYGVEPKYSVLNKWMFRITGLFNPMAKETIEMLYQFEFDYLFDSSKFENAFFKATTYQKGIQEVAKESLEFGWSPRH